MSKSAEHPSVMFSTAGRAFRVLEDGGVDVLDFLQLIIDNPHVRRDIVEACRMPTLLTSYASFNRERVALCIMNVLGWRGHTIHGYRQHVYSQLISAEGIDNLFCELSPLELTVLAMKHGLPEGSQEMSRAEVARGLKQTTARIQRIEEQLKSHFERVVHSHELKLFGTNAPIESLDLSERALNCLRRANINTIADLVKKTEDDLLALTNFGTGCLDEVVQQLSSIGLSLAIK